MNIHTGDECLRCESVGRVPNMGTIPVRYGPYEGYICTTCKEELEEEGFYSVANFVVDED